MKKLFLRLGAGFATIVTLTAEGNFKNVTNISYSNLFELTNAKEVAEDNPVDFVRFKLSNLTKTKDGDAATGAGYVYTSVYKKTVPGESTSYALLTITTTDWNTATITAQLCSKEGVVDTQTAGANENEIQPKGLNTELTDALAGGPVKAKTDLSVVDLTPWVGKGKEGRIVTTLTGPNGENYGSLSLTNIAGGGNFYTAESEDATILAQLPVVNNEVLIEAKYATAGTPVQA